MTNVRNGFQPLSDLLQDHPLLGGANKTSRQLLVDHATLCTAERGNRLYDQGDTASRCLLIESGEVSLVCYTEQGEEYVRNHFTGGNLVALPVMFMDHGRYPASAMASSAVKGYWLSRRSLLEACHQDGPLSLACLRYTSEMLRQSLIKSYSLATTDCPRRVAEYLLDLHALHNETALELPLKIGQLAANLGMRGETLSRVLASWRRQELVSGRGNKITLLNLERLRLIGQMPGR
ncbi:Crp/Fnr family transcriptional regulator [Pseudomonas fluorescens]|uniref:Crp/Fnr family transcriptional regulator n=1 Tax=Pseudomonas fluorescens TaxID=294 RepID=UPI0035244922